MNNIVEGLINSFIVQPGGGLISFELTGPEKYVQLLFDTGWEITYDGEQINNISELLTKLVNHKSEAPNYKGVKGKFYTLMERYGAALKAEFSTVAR